MEEKHIPKKKSNQKEVMDMWNEVLKNCGLVADGNSNPSSNEKDQIKNSSLDTQIESKTENNTQFEVKITLPAKNEEKSNSLCGDKTSKKVNSIRIRKKKVTTPKPELTPEQIEIEKKREEFKRQYKEARSLDKPIILPQIEGTIYYFRHIRNDFTDIPQVIDVYGFIESSREIVKIWNGMTVLVKNNCSLTDFVEFKKYLPHGTYVYTEKIKSNNKIKRFLFSEDGHYIAKSSDDNNFEFDDSLLSDEEKKYIIDDDQ